MPKIYKKKREGPFYTVDDIKRAVEDVLVKKITYREAGERYGIPTSVIYHRIKGRKVDLSRFGRGISKVLPDDVENHIVNCLQLRDRLGYSCHRKDLRKLVAQYVTDCNLKTPFKKNIPGDGWCQNFMKRYPNLPIKKQEHPQKAKVEADKPCVVYNFYDLLDETVKKADAEYKPMYVFKTNDCQIHSNSIEEYISSFSRVSARPGEESTTVMACVSADGSYMPPFIVYKGVSVKPEWTSEAAYPDTFYGASENGWIDEPNLYHWFTTSFVPFVNRLRRRKNDENQQAILIYHGHENHISVRLIEEASKGKITLLKYPSHVTSLRQPLDRYVFEPIKEVWDEILDDQISKGIECLTRDKFAEMLGQVWEEALAPNKIVCGFENTGLFPVSAAKCSLKIFNNEDTEEYQNLVVSSLLTPESAMYIRQRHESKKKKQQQHSSAHQIQVQTENKSTSILKNLLSVSKEDIEKWNKLSRTNTPRKKPLLIDKIMSLISADEQTRNQIESILTNYNMSSSGENSKDQEDLPVLI